MSSWHRWHLKKPKFCIFQLFSVKHWSLNLHFALSWGPFRFECLVYVYLKLFLKLICHKFVWPSCSCLPFLSIYILNVAAFCALSNWSHKVLSVVINWCLCKLRQADSLLFMVDGPKKMPPSFGHWPREHCPQKECSELCLCNRLRSSKLVHLYYHFLHTFILTCFLNIYNTTRNKLSYWHQIGLFKPTALTVVIKASSLSLSRTLLADVPSGHLPSASLSLARLRGTQVPCTINTFTGPVSQREREKVDQTYVTF